MDLDEIWHDLGCLASLTLERHHDLNLETKHTLSHVDVTHGNVDELLLWLTSGDQVTRAVFLGLGSLTSDLTTDNDGAANGTSSHDVTHDVVDSHTDWRSVEEFELEDLALELRVEGSVVIEWLDNDLDLVVLVVEVVSLLNDRLDLSDLSGTVLDESIGVGNSHSDLSGHRGSSDLNAGEALLLEHSLKKSVDLSVEDTIGHELLLGIKLSDSWL